LLGALFGSPTVDDTPPIFIIITVNMPRGRSWTKPETIALVSAYVHISEDAAVGTNQTAEMLFDRVVQEAKKRFAGDWSRPASASRSRWQVISREVLKFMSADLIVRSVEHSGWNDDNYYTATLRLYHRMSNKDATAEEQKAEEQKAADDEPPPEFLYKEEWLILKDHPKWQSQATPSKKNRKNNKKKHNSTLDETSTITTTTTASSDDENEERPTGVKRAKTVAGIEIRTNTIIDLLKDDKDSRATTQQNVVKSMMEEMKAASKESMVHLETVLGANTAKLTKSLDMKLLMETDLSQMSPTFQGKAKAAVENHFKSLLK
jgi:hypothetical protein